MDLDKWNVFGLLNPEFKSKIKSAFVFGDGNEALIVTDEDEVYGFGQNVGSCLGIDSAESTLTPKKVEPLCNKRVKGFASGTGSGPHVVALTEDGEIYIWGSNKFGELACEGGNIKSPTILPPLTDSLIVIEEVVCGSHHTLALDKKGKVYGWGQNSSGQIESSIRSGVSRPRQITSVIGLKRIKSIACTSNSSFAVSNSGKVYAWGSRDNGLLGVPHDTNVPQPFKIPGLDNFVVIKIACGNSHVLALSDDGKLIAWGSNNFGQLGIGSKTNVYQSPIITAADIGRIVDIAASPSCHTSAALTLTGDIYIWGQYRVHFVTSPTLTAHKLLSDVFACYARPAVLWKMLPVIKQMDSSVVESLKTAFDNPAESDFTIVVEKKPIHVHKDILKVRSEYFRSMFKGDWKEKTGPLEIEKFTYTVYKAFLYYLYTGIVKVEQESALGLLELSDFYCEESLKIKCEHIIKNSITPENAVLLYIAGVTYNTKELEDFCLKYALNHMTAVVQSDAFSAFDLETMRSFIQKASHAGAFRS